MLFSKFTRLFILFKNHLSISVLSATDKRRVIVFGSGPIRIGQGIEFDYASVHCVWALKEAGYEVVIVNNNPETVSTDYTCSDKLYFEPLTVEDVMNIVELEKPEGVIASNEGGAHQHRIADLPGCPDAVLHRLVHRKGMDAPGLLVPFDQGQKLYF